MTAIAAAAFAALVPAPVQAAPSARPDPAAPLPSPLYRAADALWEAGLIAAPHLGARPISEDRLRAILDQAIARDPARARDALRAAGLGPWGLVPAPVEKSRQPGSLPSESPWPDRERWRTGVQMAHVGEPGAASALRRIGPWDFRLTAAQVDSGRGLASFQSGGFIDDGLAAQATLGWSDVFLAHGRVDLGVRARVSRIDTQVRVLTAVARWSFGGLEMTAGREPVWLGPAREGAVLLSNEAPPFEQVRLSPSSPGRLPGILRGLGTWNAFFMVGRLAEDRNDYDNPLLLAIRVSASPIPWVEIGATRTDMFGGDGRLDRLNASDILRILTGAETNGATPPDPADNDQKAALDATLVAPFLAKVPGLRGGRFSIDYAGEDRQHGSLLPSAIAKTIGAELLTVVGSVRFESSDTVDDAARWYLHHIYTDGYRFRDRWLGHAMGSDSKWGVLEMTAPVGDGWTVSGRYEERRHGYEFGPRRTEIRRGIAVNWRGGSGAWSLRYDWRTTSGPLLADEARAEDQALEIAYGFLPR